MEKICWPRSVLPLLLCATTACWLTADESLWQNRHDGRPREQRLEDSARRDAADSRTDALADRARDLSHPDSAKADVRRDLGKPDLAKPDISKPKPDLAKPKPDMACGQMVLALALADDDGLIWSSQFFPAGDKGLLWMGYWDGAAEWSYFRFALTQALPAGATVIAATLALWGGTTDWSIPDPALEVFLENSADAAVVLDATAAPFIPGGRPVSAGVRWPAAGGLNWVQDQYNTTPNLAAVLQALVSSKGGLAAGKHVQLWVRGAQQGQNDAGTPDVSLPGYSSHPAKLTINWCY